MNDSWGIRFAYESAERKKLFFIVAFKLPTSWQSAERMSELWEDRPAYILSSTAKFAEQLHFHIFPVKTSCRLVHAFAVMGWTCNVEVGCEIWLF